MRHAGDRDGDRAHHVGPVRGAPGEVQRQRQRGETKARKRFSQRHKVGSEWVYSLDGVPRVLYNLPAVVEAVSLGKTIYVVEGEKCADALSEGGVTATTNPMGAGKWLPQYTDTLKGAAVAILPDNDPPGREHAEVVAAALTEAGAIVKVIELAKLPSKGDVVDWFDAGGDMAELEALVERTAVWRPASERHRNVWLLSDLLANDSIMRPPPPIVPRLAWAGRSTLLAAREKSGKSTLIGYIAAQVSTGGTFLDDPCELGDVLIVGLEENPGDAARRLRHFGANGKRVHLMTHFRGDPKDRPRELLEEIDRIDPVLVIVDTLAAYSDGLIQDDNNATQMTAVLQPLSALAHQRGVALVVVHHARKSDGKSRGSTAITAATDVVCEFWPPDEDADPTLRRLSSRGRVPLVRQYDMRFSGDTYSLVTSEEAPLDARIVTVVMDRPGISLTDLVDALRARRELVQRAVTDMLAKRMLVNKSDSTSRLKLIVPAHAQPGFLE